LTSVQTGGTPVFYVNPDSVIYRGSTANQGGNQTSNTNATFQPQTYDANNQADTYSAPEAAVGQDSNGADVKGNDIWLNGQKFFLSDAGIWYQYQYENMVRCPEAIQQNLWKIYNDIQSSVKKDTQKLTGMKSLSAYPGAYETLMKGRAAREKLGLENRG
jgi:hypothetical protein